MPLNLRAISRGQFKLAKRLWVGSVLLKLAMFAIALWTAIGRNSLYAPQVLLIAAIASELLQIYSDHIRGRSEAVLRTLDMCSVFAKPISETDKRDIAFNAPKKWRKQVEASEIVDDYFESGGAPRPARAVDMLLESAWYTKQQAGRMAGLYLVWIALMLATSIAALIIANREIDDLQSREQVMRIVTAWLLLIVSLSMLKSAWAYFRLFQRCAKTEISCSHLKRTSVTKEDALKQWHEYHLTRASSPLLPEWLWLYLKKRLDNAWQAGVRS